MTARSSLFFAAVLLIFFTACENNTATFHKEQEKENPLLYEKENIDCIFHVGGIAYHIDAMLEEDSIFFRDSVFIPGFNRYIPKRDTIFAKRYPHGIKITFRVDTVQKTLTADKAVCRNSIFEFTGDVQLISGDFQLSSDTLKWDKLMDKFYTESAVELKTKKDILQGSGFEANSALTKFQISRMTGTIKTE